MIYDINEIKEIIIPIAQEHGVKRNIIKWTI